MRGVNSSQIRAHYLEIVKGVTEDVITVKRADSIDEQKRTGKGKLIKAHLNSENEKVWDKKCYSKGSGKCYGGKCCSN